MMQTPLFHEKLLDFCRARLCDDYALLAVLLSVYRLRGDCPFVTGRLREDIERWCREDEIAISATFLAKFLGISLATVERHLRAFCSKGFISKIRKTQTHSVYRIEPLLACIADFAAAPVDVTETQDIKNLERADEKNEAGAGVNSLIGADQNFNA